MEPVLTQEELEAIYSAMKADSSSQKAVDDYILASDHAYNMRCLHKWTDVSKMLAPRIESIFVGTLGVRGKVEIQDVRTIEDERSQNDLLNPPGMNQVIPLAQTDSDSEYVVIALGETKMLLGLERPAAHRFVSRKTATGSREEEESGETPNELTVLESRLLLDFFNEISQEIGAVITQLGTVSVTRLDPEDFWVDRVPKGTWINTRLSSSTTPGISVWLRGPADVFLPKAQKATDKLKSVVSESSVELVMELGKLTLNAVDLWELNVGSVYPLGVAANEPLNVMVGGVCKLLGKPTVSRGHVAFEIVERNRNRKTR